MATTRKHSRWWLLALGILIPAAWAVGRFFFLSEPEPPAAAAVIQARFDRIVNGMTAADVWDVMYSPAQKKIVPRPGPQVPNGVPLTSWVDGWVFEIKFSGGKVAAKRLRPPVPQSLLEHMLSTIGL